MKDKSDGRCASNVKHCKLASSFLCIYREILQTSCNVVAGKCIDIVALTLVIYRPQLERDRTDSQSQKQRRR